MKMTLRLLAVIAVVIFAGCRSVAAGEVSPTPLEVTVETADGSRIVGTAAPQTVTFSCASTGTMSTPLAALSSIDRHYGWQTYRFTFRNGDVFHGVPAQGSLEVDAPFGRVAVPIFHITHADIVHPPLDAFPILFDDPGEVFEWTGYQNVAVPTIVDGALTFECAGHGYLHRANLKIPALSCPVLVIRMKTDAGTMGLVYWMTDTRPGFADPAFLSFETIPDGQFHDYAIPVGAHSLWSGTITALRVDGGVDAGANKSLVAFESLSAAPAGESFPETVREEHSFDILDGKPFKPMPAWVAPAVPVNLGHVAEPGFAHFYVTDRDASVKWYRAFPNLVEFPGGYSEIEISYQAWELADDDGYAIWFFDCMAGESSGFEAVALKDLIDDGRIHTLRIPLSQFDRVGAIDGCAVRVKSGPIGWGFILFHKFRFVGAVSAPPAAPRPEPLPDVLHRPRFR